MKLVISFCLLLLLFLYSPIVFSQNENQKEVVISGVKYVLHTVKKSETVFSICQKYKVTQAELQQANPGLKTILETGSIVKIPVGKVVTEPQKEPVKSQTAPVEEFYYHKVAKNQTLVSIAKQYGITANDLIRNNPELTNGLVIGQVLKIPADLTNIKDQPASEFSAVSDTQADLSGYTVHPVVSGETLYSLEQRYGITHEEMMKANPALQGGLKAGMKLKIPVKKVALPEPATISNQSYTKYQVEKGETLFSLASRFGVEVGDLKKANPSLLSRSLETGEIILIPQRMGKSAETPVTKSPVSNAAEEQVTTNCEPIKGKNNQKYKAGLLLPLYLPGNDQAEAVSANKALLMSKISIASQPLITSTDTGVIVNGTNIDQKAISYLEFYEGALLAIDSLQRSGMNIELFVFDVTNQQMINSLLLLDEFRELNLIIGPVLPEFQQSVASFAAKNRIPMISPLSVTGSFEKTNSYYFKVNPDKDYQTEQAAEYIASEFRNKNFILLQLDGNSTSAEAKLGQLAKEKLGGSLFHEYNFKNQGVNSIKSLLDETGENIFFIPTDNEAQVSIAVTNLNALAENYNIVLMGTPTLTKLKSLQTESFHRIRLRYLTPYFVDYNKPLVRRFVSQYRETFATEPTQFSFQGFDVSFYFLNALYRFGADFRNCLPNYPMELTQMDFNFRKVAPMGGFMNHSLFVNSYERNFDILNFDVVVGQ
jgi:LysM repeat protein/ABC-type branched-subunit amino acid transport system substrate-binding protein